MQQLAVTTPLSQSELKMSMHGRRTGGRLRCLHSRRSRVLSHIAIGVGLVLLGVPSALVIAALPRAARVVLVIVRGGPGGQGLEVEARGEGLAQVLQEGRQRMRPPAGTRSQNPMRQASSCMQGWSAKPLVNPLLSLSMDSSIGEGIAVKHMAARQAACA